ncbi:MAG: iron donor protein CyaY [Acidobacteriota bacterium]
MDDQEFQTRADTSLQDLYNRLARAAEDFDFEVDFNSGALAVEFEDPPAKFVVSPNSPVKQIWVSAHSKSFKLDWDAARATFVLPATAQSLAEMMADAVTKQIGQAVTL